MAQRRKATRNAAGGELSEKQVEAEFDRIRDAGQRIKRAATLRTIKRYYEADDIEVTSKKASLICPISKARVRIPVRSVNCRHIECFDLRSYLNYHQQLTYWECPFSFCKAQARCDSLRVDEYMAEVIGATDDHVPEVEIFADGSFKAVQRPTPTETETIDDEDPYIPDTVAELIIKNEANNDSPADPMGTAVFHTDEGQPQAHSVAAGCEEQPREGLRQSRQLNATLRCALGSATNQAEQAESVSSELRDEDHRLREEPAAKALDTREPTATNQEQHARLDVVHTAAEATQQMDHEPIESESFSMDQDLHESSLSLVSGNADNDAAQAPISSGPSTQEQTQIELDDYSASDASISLLDHSDASAMQSDSDCEKQPGHAPKQHKKKQKSHFTCAVCGRVFGKSSNLRTHERTHTGEKPHKCGQCDKAFTDSSSLRRHVQLHTGVKPHKCGLCGKAFAEAGNLRNHERIHTGERPFKCARCGKAFTDSSKLRNHERTHTGETPFKCAQCGKAFARSSILRAHARTHTGVKPYECAQCGSAFTQSSSLRQHMQLHAGGKPYKCRQCDKAFAQSGNLRAHERTHTGVKHYKCAQCGKAFVGAGALRTHVRIHTSVKPFKCAQCGKAFTQSCSLRNHERTHTGEKPFKCAQCRKEFSQSCSLRRHERIHTGEKPYECAQCGTAFTHSKSLVCHQRIHTGEKPYKCGQCGAAFGHSNTLRYHERTQHPVAEPSQEATKRAAQARSQSEA